MSTLTSEQLARMEKLKKELAERRSWYETWEVSVKADEGNFKIGMRISDGDDR